MESSIEQGHIYFRFSAPQYTGINDAMNVSSRSSRIRFITRVVSVVSSAGIAFH